MTRELLSLPPGPHVVRTWADIAEMHWLCARLCWPADPRRQNNAVATWAAAIIGALEQIFRPETMPRLEALYAALCEDLQDVRTVVPDVPDLERRLAELRAHPAYPATVEPVMAEAEGAIRREMLDPAGGWLRLAEASGLAAITADVTKAAATGEGAAGEALFWLACAATHHARELPSLGINRVLAAMERPGRSLRLLKDAWSKARAQHAWAAFFATIVERVVERGVFITMPPVPGTLADVLEEVLINRGVRERFFGHAAWFAHWGAHFVPVGATRPVLDPKRLVPFGDAAPLAPVLPPVPRELLDRMRAYRVPAKAI